MVQWSAPDLWSTHLYLPLNYLLLIAHTPLMYQFPIAP
jgi:hypothetical protein